jgi:phosphatidylglycerol:prolipoprotein diacylglycerol transferase
VHSSYLQLGRLHIPIYGVFAALGLMAALALCQRTARYAGLSPDAVWNAGATAILSAFAVSRLLLIAFNLRSFLQYPLLVLALPSLTTTGMLFTSIFMLEYVRWRRLPLLPLLDSATPCVALLWVFLSLGREFDGTRDGMPMHASGGTGGPIAARPEPVELFAALAAFFIFRTTLKTLKDQSDAPRAGTVAATGLVTAGAALFFLDFLHLPSDLLPNLWLDPSQIIGTAMILAGAGLLLRARTSVKRESGTETTDAV